MKKPLSRGQSCHHDLCVDLQVMPPFEDVSIKVTANDFAVVLLNDVPVLFANGASESNRIVGASYAKFVVEFTELTENAFITILMAINSSTYSAVPMWRVYPVQPGGITPVAVRVSGIGPAQPLCNTTTLSAAPAAASTAVPEATSVSVPAGTCGYLYSSHRTPTLVSAMGLSASADSTPGLGPSGISFHSTGQLQVRRNRKLGFPGFC
jgi:hypothetical protein